MKIFESFEKNSQSEFLKRYFGFYKTELLLLTKSLCWNPLMHNNHIFSPKVHNIRKTEEFID